jgi:hypothetical protein
MAVKKQSAKKTRRRKRQQDEKTAVAVPMDASSLPFDKLPEHETARPLRQAQVLQLQERHGNAHVRNRLKPSSEFAPSFKAQPAPGIQRALSDAEQLEDLTSSRFAGDPDLENAYDNSPVLRKGDKGEGVSKVQQALIDLGFSMPISTKDGSPDGDFGGETKKIIRKFQEKFNLGNDGKVGRETMGKLDALFGKDGPKPKTIVVNNKVLQGILNDINGLPDVDPGIALDLKEVAEAFTADPEANLQFLPILEQMRQVAVEKEASDEILEAIDVCIRPLTVRIGITTSKDELDSGATELSDSQRDEAAKALKPKPQTPGGVQPDFVSVLPNGKDYRARVKKYLEEAIDGLNQKLVVDKGPADRTPDNLHSWDRLGELANAAKAEVDIVFGNFKKAPPLKPEVNLFDQFEDEEALIADLSPEGKKEKANNLVGYFIQSGRERLRTINKEHGAAIGRQTLSPNETKSEFEILEELRAEIVSVHETTLLEIDRGWEASQGGGAIYMQRWKQDTDAETRHFFWDMFQTMIHEYLHLIKHPRYDTYATSFGENSAQENTLIEGMDSVLTETVWANVESRIQSPGIRLKVEGPGLAEQDWDDNVVPPIDNRRYPSYDEAMHFASIVGMQNVLAAYFLGNMKGWPKPEHP